MNINLIKKSKVLALILVLVMIFICYDYAFSNWYYRVNNYGDQGIAYGHSQYGIFVIPSNSYYYIAGYDRNGTTFYNGQPMISRVPVLGGNYYYPTQVANGIIYSAYVSISKWCNEKILYKDAIQDYFLNYASIVSETPTTIVMNVNCAFQKRGILDGYIEFKITIDIERNRYTWRKLNRNADLYDDDYYYRYRDRDRHEYRDYYDEIYDYDSDTGSIIIIR